MCIKPCVLWREIDTFVADESTNPFFLEDFASDQDSLCGDSRNFIIHRIQKGSKIPMIEVHVYEGWCFACCLYTRELTRNHVVPSFSSSSIRKPAVVLLVLFHQKKIKLCYLMLTTTKHAFLRQNYAKITVEYCALKKC